MRVVCISDTHNNNHKIRVPDGDVLVHAGDLTMQGYRWEVAPALEWLASLPHRHKVFVAGNHDFMFEEKPEEIQEILGRLPGLTYLHGTSAQIEGLTFWGGPWTLWFGDWAFTYKPSQAKALWSRIPSKVDVLVTHEPPKGIMDRVPRGEDVGCQELLDAIQEVGPRLHVFGHIHESHGQKVLGDTTFVNAAIGYRMEHRPIVVDL